MIFVSEEIVSVSFIDVSFEVFNSNEFESKKYNTKLPQKRRAYSHTSTILNNVRRLGYNMKNQTKVFNIKLFCLRLKRKVSRMIPLKSLEILR